MAWGKALLVSWGLVGTALPSAILPDSRLTGAIDARVTQANIHVTICRPGYARSVRSPYAVTRRLKRAAMIRGGHYGQRYSAYEFDHLVPLSLGGAPTDARNLWLEPVSGTWSAVAKDQLENVLWVKVCRGEIPLNVAQRAISADWIAAYNRWIDGRIRAPGRFDD
jgi:hypothetical protein